MAGAIFPASWIQENRHVRALRSVVDGYLLQREASELGALAKLSVAAAGQLGSFVPAQGGWLASVGPGLSAITGR